MVKTLMVVFVMLFAGAGLRADDEPKEYGGNGGSAFKDAAPKDEKVSKITLRSGTSVDQIRFYWENGKSEERGGSGGKPHTIELGKDEYIAEVVVYYDGAVDGLEFKIRNKTNEATVRDTERYGNKSKNRAVIKAPDDKAITGMFGRSGDKIDSIGFFFGNR